MRSEMHAKIKDIINSNPKKYSQIVKRDLKLMNWVNANTLVDLETTTTLSEKIYSALYQTTGVCVNNSIKKFISITKGYGFCGHASTCSCSNESLTKKISESKTKYSDEKKKAIESKRTSTMVLKYGKKYNSQRDEVRTILAHHKVSDENFEKLNDFEWLNTAYNVNQRSLVDIGKELGIYYGTVGEYCVKHNFPIRKRSSYSMIEIEVRDFIQSHGFTVEHSNWDILGSHEIDLYVPDKKLAIEIDGLYWHSYSLTGKKENKMRHISKTNAASAKGVNLIHVTDYEWENKKELIKSFILVKLGKSSKLYARKCYIGSPSKKDEIAFLNENHLQGSISSEFAVGLYFEGKLVALMTIGKSRYDKSNVKELLRFCTLKNTVIIGGAEKLFEEVKNKCQNLPIVSYCDLSKFSGKVYGRLGFEKSASKVTPGYFWTNGSIMISRFKCWKSQIKKWLPTYDSTLSEAANMFNAGYRRFWDCGQQKFTYTL